MDEEITKSTLKLTMADLWTDDTTEHVVEYCMFDCGETPDVAWRLGYDRPYGRTAYTGWLFICELCDGESRKLAPYWWNKALRGESLVDEEE